MARKLRIQYPGAIYHVMNRGDHQETIFCDDDDRKLFVATLAEGCQKTAFQIHSFCLMSSHFHLVVETRGAAGQVALRGGAFRIGGSQSRTPHRRSAAGQWRGAGADRRLAQRASLQGAAGSPAPSRNHRHSQLDCPAVDNGNPRSFGPPALPQRAASVRPA